MANNDRITKVQPILSDKRCPHCHGHKTVKNLACPVCRGKGKDGLITK